MREFEIIQCGSAFHIVLCDFLVDSDMLLPLRTMILDIHTMELGTWKSSDGDFISSSIKLGYVISMTFL